MNERLMTVVRKPWAIPASVGVVGFAVGVGVGYILGNRKVTVIPAEPEKEDDTVVEFKATTSDLKDGANRLHPSFGDGPARTKLSPEDKEKLMLEAYMARQAARPDPADIEVDEELLAEMNAKEDDQMPKVTSIFRPSSDSWNYEEEVPKRTKDAPYIIHEDEYWAQESEINQSTLTYYAGDDILTDSDNVPIYDYSRICGPMRFGHGSSDQNRFHVRNEKYQGEYEILLDPGSYSQEILGYEADSELEETELKHTNGLRKFRPDE